MKRVALSIAGLLLATTAVCTEYHVTTTGSGGACSIGTPCTLKTATCGTQCGKSVQNQPGDIVWIHAGTYTQPSPGASQFVIKGYQGNHLADVTYRNYQNGEAVIDCGADGAQPCWANAISPIAFGTVNATSGSKTVTFAAADPASTYVADFSAARGSANWHNQTIYINFQPYLVDTVTDSTHLQLTANFDQPDGTYVHFIPSVARFVTTWGLKFINGWQGPRIENHGYVSVVKGSPNVTWSANGQIAGTKFEVSPSAIVSTNGTTVTWVSGRQFTLGTSWPGKDITIVGVRYNIASVQSVTSLTISTTAGVQTSVAAVVPGLFSNEIMTIDAQGTPEARTISNCATTTTCVLKSNVTHDNGDYISHYTDLALYLTGSNNVLAYGFGGKIINCYIFDGSGGTTMAGAEGGKILWYGNLHQYFGEVGDLRSYGHGQYIENRQKWGEFSRSVSKNNVIVRPFFLGTQVYAGNTDVAYVSEIGNTYLSNGHGVYPTVNWPAKGSTSTINSLGAAGLTPSAGCQVNEGGPGGSTKLLTRYIADRAFMFNPGAAPYNIGYQKGSCNTTIMNGYYVATGHPTVTTNQTFGFLTITGNTWMFGTPNGAGGPEPNTWTLAHYPACISPGVPAGCNTYLPGIPTTGPDVPMYRPNEYEQGRGHVAVFNPDLSPTTTIDVCQMGGYVGEEYRIFNAQAGDPWDDTPIATGTVASCPANVVVSMTLSAGAIRQPGYTSLDLVTPFPKPPDIGPDAAAFLLYPDWNLAVTPTVTPSLTPTNTNTPSRTPTFTPSLTPTNTPSRTPTFTPSITPSSTRTFTPSTTPTGTLPPTATYTPSATNTNTATNTPSRTNTPSNTATFTASATPTRTPTPSGGGSSSASIDFSTCITSPPMAVTADASFPSSYVSSAVGQTGQTNCQFNIPSDGTYYGYVKVLAETFLTDSFYISVNGDGGSTCETDGDVSCGQIFDAASSKNEEQGCQITHSWGSLGYINLNQKNILTGACHGEGARWSKQLFVANNPQHIIFRQRDADTRLYYLIFSTNPNLEPSDPLPTPTPGPVTGGCFRYCRCHGKERPVPVSCDAPKFGPCVPCPW